MTLSKPLLRQKCLKARKLFVSKYGALGLVQPIINFMKEERGIWGGFMPTPTEPNLQAVYESQSGVTWAFPSICDEQMQYRIPSIRNGFIKNSLGILEPDPQLSTAVKAQDLAGVLVPGVAFDKNGYRLGRGRGYFDRYLSGFKGRKVGVCFSVQLLSQLPHDTHDIRMDVVITEDKVIRISA